MKIALFALAALIAVCSAQSCSCTSGAICNTGYACCGTVCTPYDGYRTLGSACSGNSGCASCATGSCTSGVCTSGTQLGYGCTCTSGSQCITGNCLTSGTTSQCGWVNLGYGATCNAWNTCTTGLTCVSGTCQGSAVGAGCGYFPNTNGIITGGAPDNSNCTTGNYCNDNYICAALLTTGQAVTGAGHCYGGVAARCASGICDNSHCIAAVSTGGNCTYNTQCSSLACYLADSSSSSFGKCVSQTIASGSKCDAGSTMECVSGTFCYLDADSVFRCRADSTFGGACTGNYQCPDYTKSGFGYSACSATAGTGSGPVAGVCNTTRLGQACSQTSDCASLLSDLYCACPATGTATTCQPVTTVTDPCATQQAALTALAASNKYGQSGSSIASALVTSASDASVVINLYCCESCQGGTYYPANSTLAFAQAAILYSNLNINCLTKTVGTAYTGTIATARCAGTARTTNAAQISDVLGSCPSPPPSSTGAGGMLVPSLLAVVLPLVVVMLGF